MGAKMLHQDYYVYQIFEENNNIILICAKRQLDKTTIRKDLLESIDKNDLVDLFWDANSLSFEDKQKLVTYLNARGHNLKLFRGEMRGNLHYNTHYFDGVSWMGYEPEYEA